MAGYVIAVTGGKGGVGKSVFAANLAYAFSRETNSRSCLIDLDLRAQGDQNHINGLHPPKTLVDIANHPSSLDKRSVGNLIPLTKGGIAYMGLPVDPSKLEKLDSETLGRVFKACSKIFSITVIDCGSDLNEYTAKALEASTAILVVSTPDILVINQTRKIISEIRQMLFPDEMVQVVLNRYQKSSTMPAGMIQKSIGKNIFGAIHEDAATCMNSLVRRAPFVVAAPRVPITRAYHDLVRKMIQQGLLEKLSKLKKPERVEASKKAHGGSSKSTGVPSLTGKSDPWTMLKLRVHKGLVEQMDLKKGDVQSRDDPKAKEALREKTKKKVLEILNNEDTRGLINGRDDRGRLVKEILDEALALGPLEDLLSDPEVTEIMVNAKDQIYIERKGKPALCKTVFSSDHQLMNVIERIVSPLGRRIDEKTPYVDARLEDGSRVHAIIPPLALRGPTISIRKFPKDRMEVKDLIRLGSMTEEIADFLRICVEGKLNIVVAGGTGSGKTTLLNTLSGFIPASERIITIEDSAELQLSQEHLVRLESRPANIEGEGEVSIRDLVKQTLRMRPDRVVVGECRAGEALDMLQAMNTGHDGSLTTIHANSPRDALARLETLVMMSGLNMPTKAIREQISSAIHLVVQQSRLSDGSRKITHITEITGMQGETISSQDIFVFKQEGFDKKRRVKGRYVATGFVPKFVEKMEAKGLKIPRGLFAGGKAA